MRGGGIAGGANSGLGPKRRLSHPAPQRYLDWATRCYQNGYSDYLTVVDAERNLYTAQLQYVQDQGSLFVALVNLYKALGGGWIEQAEQMSSAPAKLATSPPPGS